MCERSKMVLVRTVNCGGRSHRAEIAAIEATFRLVILAFCRTWQDGHIGHWPQPILQILAASLRSEHLEELESVIVDLDNCFTQLVYGIPNQNSCIMNRFVFWAPPSLVRQEALASRSFRQRHRLDSRSCASLPNSFRLCGAILVHGESGRVLRMISIAVVAVDLLLVEGNSSLSLPRGQVLLLFPCPNDTLLPGGSQVPNQESCRNGKVLKYINSLHLDSRDCDALCYSGFQPMNIKKQRLLTPGPTRFIQGAAAMLGADIHHRTRISAPCIRPFWRPEKWCWQRRMMS